MQSIALRCPRGCSSTERMKQDWEPIRGDWGDFPIGATVPTGVPGFSPRGEHPKQRSERIHYTVTLEQAGDAQTVRFIPTMYDMEYLFIQVWDQKRVLQFKRGDQLCSIGSLVFVC